MTPRYSSIQYLRGLAATLVVASHAFLYPLSWNPLIYDRWGWLGVILFFVISGFIMVVVTGDRNFDGISFLRRRAVRVIPMYWGITVITAALALVAPALFKTMAFDWTQLWRSLLFIPFFNETSGGIHPIYKLGWTLNYEMYFYLCFAALWFLNATSRVLTLTLVFVCLALYGTIVRPVGDLQVFYTSYMPLAFCAGMGIALIALRGSFRAPLVTTAATVVAGAIGLAVGLYWPAAVVEDFTAFVGCLTFASAVVFLGIQFGHILPKSGILERSGDASYSTYLTHIYVVGGLSLVAYAFLPQGNAVVYVGVAVMTIACAIAAGMLVHQALERPLTRWLTSFASRNAHRYPAVMR